MAIAAFHQALRTAQYRIPGLMRTSDRWLSLIIPYVRATITPAHTPRPDLVAKWSALCDANIKGLTFGWELGDVNPQNILLNQKLYPDDSAGSEGKVAIAEALTVDLCLGRCILWRGPIRGKMPLFVRPKRVCPITGAVLVWRVIRDASCGSLLWPSLNSLTPDSAAYMKLPSKHTIAVHMYIMHALWGPGFHFAKTDMAAAFRQFFLARTEPSKIVYEFDGELVGDLCNIWGTRHASRICQDFTILVCRFFMVAENGQHLINDINHATEDEDILYFIKKLSIEVSDLDHVHNEEFVYTQKLLWKWSAHDVQRWLQENNLNGMEMLENITSGRALIRMNESRVLALHGSAARDQLRTMDFFESLIRLKLASQSIINVLGTPYVDDFMLLLPPARDRAALIFKRFTDFLRVGAVDEQASKRDGPAQILELIGLTADSNDMTLECPSEKRQKICAILSKALLNGIIFLREYESLIGKLANVAELAWPAKAFLRRMREHLLKLIQRHGRGDAVVAVLTEWEIRDFRWWLRYIDTVTKVCVLQLLDPSLPSIEIHFDGATNGSRANGWSPALGVWFKGHYIAERIPREYTDAFTSHNVNYEREYAIAHFEMMAIVVGLHTLRHIIGCGVKIMLKTDNKHVEAAIINKSTDDEFLMSAVRWLCMFAVAQQLRMYIIYVPTKHNCIPDAASRFDLDKLESLATRECQQNGWTLHRVRQLEFPDLTEW